MTSMVEMSNYSSSDYKMFHSFPFSANSATAIRNPGHVNPDDPELL